MRIRHSPRYCDRGRRGTAGRSLGQPLGNWEGAAEDDPEVRINRGENNITILDDITLAFKEQISTGAGSFAQDVAVVGQKLYVPATGTKGVVVLTRGSTATAEIDLSARSCRRCCSTAWSATSCSGLAHSRGRTQ